jgi:protein-tyrosine phosphatase
LSQTAKNRVLFLCTGNYYRSRFAEILFNALAGERGLEWVADSRGLAIGPENIGPVSSFTLDGLQTRGIEPTNHERMPRPLLESELAGAQLVIALDRAEHLPHIQSKFPWWVDRIVFWQVPDLDRLPSKDALAIIDRQVRALVDKLDRDPH